MSFSFQGEGVAPRRLTHARPNADLRFVRYEYAATIALVQNQIFYSSQEMRVWSRTKVVSATTTKPDLHFKWSYDVLRDHENFLSIVFDLSKFDLPSGREPNSFLDFVENRSLVESPFYNLFGYLFRFVTTIRKDLRSGQAYNIVPSAVREPADIAESPGLEPDGSGLAATIQALKRIASSSGQEYPILRYHDHQFSPNAHDRLQEFAMLIDPTISAIEVEANSIANQILVFCIYIRGPELQKVPISVLSDGTAKWIALATALVTVTSAFCIEEPENFLHPRLQEEIVAIIRSVLEEDGATQRFALLTSHSETLLNALHPEEIVIARMEGGVTRCQRTQEAGRVDELINETGFGLGYYYRTGALELL